MFIDSNEFLKKLHELPEQKTVYICGHTNPDMDSIGSCFALANYLLTLRKNVKILLNEKDFSIAEDLENKELLTNEITEQEFNFIMVDCNEKKRLKNFENNFDKAQFKLNIDHHEDNKDESNFSFSISEASSTCELIFKVLSQDKNFKLSKEIAKNLYLGMMTDTNCFQRRLGNETLIIAQKLINMNINHEELIKKYFLSRTMTEIKAFSKLVNDLKFDTFYYVVADKEQEPYKNLSHNSFVKKIAEDMRKIDAIDVLVFLIKDKNIYTAKTMSNKSNNADKISALFGGGGHKKEAGFTTDLPLETIVEKIKNYLNKQQ